MSTAGERGRSRSLLEWLVFGAAVSGLCAIVVPSSGCVGEVSGSFGEICDNLVDDDDDLVADCDDPECVGDPACVGEVSGVGGSDQLGSGTCGQLGQSCCAGSACASGWVCLDNLCALSQSTCGGEQQVCCPGEVCNAGFQCSGYRCLREQEDCGGHQQPCCEGASCDPSLLCLRGACSPCGEEGQPCCDSGQCEQGLACEGERCTSGACGGERQPCCSGDVCNGSEAVCVNDICAPCGGEGEVCCARGCTAGLTCERNHCVNPSTGSGGGSTTVDCSGHRDCAACIAADGCGWCDASNTCMPGGFAGPDAGSCSWLDWDYVNCEAETDTGCSGRTDCASCIETDGCGWCSATSTCMAGDFMGPSVSECGWFDWDFMDC